MKKRVIMKMSSKIMAFITFVFTFILQRSDLQRIPEQRQQCLQNLTNWLIEGGAKWTKIVPTWFPGEGYTVVATENIERGEILAYVPENLFLGPKAAAESVIGPHISHLPAPDQVKWHNLVTG